MTKKAESVNQAANDTNAKINFHRGRNLNLGWEIEDTPLCIVSVERSMLTINFFKTNNNWPWSNFKI